MFAPPNTGFGRRGLRHGVAIDNVELRRDVLRILMVGVVILAPSIYMGVWAATAHQAAREAGMVAEAASSRLSQLEWAVPELQYKTRLVWGVLSSVEARQQHLVEQMAQSARRGALSPALHNSHSANAKGDDASSR
jgi:hypothetical protein